MTSTTEIITQAQLLYRLMLQLSSIFSSVEQFSYICNTGYTGSLSHTLKHYEIFTLTKLLTVGCTLIMHTWA